MKFLATLLVVGSVMASPSAHALYGAIAYSESTRQMGYSFGQLRPDTAQIIAISYCSAPDCRAVTTIFNQCAALATGDYYYRHGLATANTRFEAQWAAMALCQANNINCVDKAWVCSNY